MNYPNLLRETTAKIKDSSLNPLLDAKIILDYVLQESPERLLAKTSIKLSAKQKALLSRAILRFKTGEPLAYIMGYADFLGFKIEVSPKTLIPRPETEFLAVSVINLLLKFPKKKFKIFELGLGSGCIPVAILNNCYDYISKYTGIDIDPSCVLQAQRNVCINLDNKLANTAEDLCSLGCIDFFSSNFRYMLENDIFPLPECDIFISNPPYIATSTVERSLQKSVVDYEPKIALDGGDDGLKFYEMIRKYLIEVSPQLPYLFLEIDTPIAANVENLYNDIYPHVEIKKDLFGEDRYLIAMPV